MCVSYRIHRFSKLQIFMTTYYHYYKSPVGKLLLVGDGLNLTALGFPYGKMKRKSEVAWIKDGSTFKNTVDQLEAFFAGERKSFDLNLSVMGTPFRKSVWSALMDIPYGETWSYSELANHIGRPNACRAVGSANGMNPIPIIIPCHRVIGSNGSLTGFGGGLKTKKFLLELESKNNRVVKIGE